MSNQRPVRQGLAMGLAALALAGVVASAPALAQPQGLPQPAPVNRITAAPAVVNVTTANLAEVKAMGDQRPVVILVTAPSWCGACQQLDPVIHDLANRAGGAWTLAVIDVDRAGGAEREFRANAYPTMLGWGHGKELQVDRMIGFPGQQGTAAWIDKVVQAYGPAPKPTQTPTVTPTQTPSPTVKPTVSPTATPTVAPTPQPTVTPTQSPTVQPTTEPTQTPAPQPDDGNLPPLPEGAVQLTDQNFEESVIQESSKRTVIIDISKDKCGPCLTLAPVMDEKYRADAGKWQYTRLDGTAYPELWKRYDNPWFPTLIAIKDGKEVARRSGYNNDKAAVVKWIDDAANGRKPANDPLVMEVKGTKSFRSMLELSTRHPVALRVNLDSHDKSGAAQRQIAETMAKGDGGKWTLANQDVIKGGLMPLYVMGVDLSRTPQVVVVYNKKIRLEPLAGDYTEAELRTWVDTMLSTHYPEN